MKITYRHFYNKSYGKERDKAKEVYKWVRFSLERMGVFVRIVRNAPLLGRKHQGKFGFFVVAVHGKSTFP